MGAVSLRPHAHAVAISGAGSLGGAPPGSEQQRIAPAPRVARGPGRAAALTIGAGALAAVCGLLFLRAAMASPIAAAESQAIHSMGHMSMHMTFYQSTSVALWLDAFTIHDEHAWLPYCALLGATFAMCVFHEWLTMVRVLRAAGVSGGGNAHHPADVEEGGEPREPLLAQRSSERPASRGSSAAASGAGDSRRLLLTALYGANATCSYLIMLAIMTYNVGVCVAVVAGLSVGYFYFGHLRAAGCGTGAAAGGAGGGPGAAGGRAAAAGSDICCPTTNG